MRGDGVKYLFPQLPPGSSWGCPCLSTQGHSSQGLLSTIAALAKVLVPAPTPCCSALEHWDAIPSLGVPLKPTLYQRLPATLSEYATCLLPALAETQAHGPWPPSLAWTPLGPDEFTDTLTQHCRELLLPLGDGRGATEVEEGEERRFAGMDKLRRWMRPF